MKKQCLVSSNNILSAVLINIITTSVNQYAPYLSPARTVQFKFQINHSLQLCHVMAKQPILTGTSELHLMKIYAV